MTLRTDYCGTLTADDIGRTVTLCGWVARRREHGEHLAFVDLRDHTGIVQCVVGNAHDLRSEYVLKVTGTVRRRPEGTTNDHLKTGEIEIGGDDVDVEVLNTAEPPPFPVSDRIDADESVRLKYRYVDMRRDRMQRNLRIRSLVNSTLRASMERQGFPEIETPILWTPTPEGSREFLVPSRLQPGKQYSLPQSPQIAKQLLMVAGFDRYFQIARCLRDEDLRADRQFEFMQLDIEASFVEPEDVYGFIGEAVGDATEAVIGERPDIERLPWVEAMERFGVDKPDLRFGMELTELTALFAATEFNAFKAGTIKGIRVPGKAEEFGRNKLDGLTDKAKQLGAKGLVWMKVKAGPELDSPVAKFLSDKEKEQLVATLEAEPGDLLLIVADDERRLVQDVLGQLRNDLGRPPVSQGPYRFVWVTEFPMFDGRDDAGNPQAAHHPFTMPHPDDLDLLETDPMRVRSQAYDLVLNGSELGSGSIRIHRSDIQARVFTALGISDEEAEARFGFLLGAFKYGAPPHGGFAVGLDRFVAILAGEDNIREVIAFPKASSGIDPMTGAPKEVDPKVLADVGLRPLPPPK
ncbi:MAG: aspartyl-tRNA synthetase [Actinomycetota bacterium]|jgi:aspartyl-tRNA synthetase|nr:aspartyl-tRNA synthetase [Actinomycetota bacterium]